MIDTLWVCFGFLAVGGIAYDSGKKLGKARGELGYHQEHLEKRHVAATHLHVDGFVSFLIDGTERTDFEKTALEQIRDEYRPQFEIEQLPVAGMSIGWRAGAWIVKISASM